jgi:tryptophan synthase alpha chain
VSALRAGGGPYVAAYLPAGFPSREAFLSILPGISASADVVEVGVPFTDPMADGLTLRRASRTALAQGTSLAWILEALGTMPPHPARYLMTYLNPVLAFGVERLAARAAGSGVRGVVVPDLPLEEMDLLRALADAGVEIVPLVAPTTPPGRLRRLCASGASFVYAITRPGTTGGTACVDAGLRAFLDRVRGAAGATAVLAGFGVHAAEQATALRRHADGVVVGSALVEDLEAGRDPVARLTALRRAME